jgi:hypothetical protein
VARLSAKLRSNITSNGEGVSFWCPGCGEYHAITTRGGSPWRWDGNVDAPTFEPSILVTSGHFVPGHAPGERCWCVYNAENPTRPAPFVCHRCHSFVRGGRIQFLGDCSHALAGTTVDLPDLPAETGPGPGIPGKSGGPHI